MEQLSRCQASVVFGVEESLASIMILMHILGLTEGRSSK
jgi:hypothetical protein